MRRSGEPRQGRPTQAGPVHARCCHRLGTQKTDMDAAAGIEQGAVVSTACRVLRGKPSGPEGMGTGPVA